MTVIATYECYDCSDVPAEMYGEGEQAVPLCSPCKANVETPFDVDAPVDETSRRAMIRWLIQNDPNGCYGDQEVREEIQEEPLTFEQVTQEYKRQRYGIDYEPNPS